MNSSNEQMPALPGNPDAAEAVVRALLMKEAIVLLKASGLKYTQAQFTVATAFDDEHAQKGEPADPVQTMHRSTGAGHDRGDRG